MTRMSKEVSMKTLEELIDDFDFHDREQNSQALTTLVYEIKKHYGNEGLEVFRERCLTECLKSNDDRLPDNPTEEDLEKHADRERTLKGIHWSAVQVQRQFKNPLSAASEANLRMAKKFEEMRENLNELVGFSDSLQETAKSLTAQNP